MEEIWKVLLGASATVLFGIFNILLKIGINKFTDLEIKTEQGRKEIIMKTEEAKGVLSTLVSDVAVIKEKINNSEYRITMLEHDFKKLSNELSNIRNKMQSCYRAKGRYDEEGGQLKNSLPWKVIDSACNVYGLDRNLVGAIILQESAGHNYAIRYEPEFKYRVNPEKYARLNGISIQTEDFLQACSIGVMQTMGCIARELGFSGNLLELTETEISISLGCKKLLFLGRKYTDFSEMVASYNAGSPRFDKYGRLVNQAYVDGVLKHMEEIRSIE